MMRMIAKTYKSLSRRALSVILAVAVFVSMILAVVSGVIFVSLAGNPQLVKGLNRSVPVQQIDLMPTVADREIRNKSTNAFEGYSRTTLYASSNGKLSGDYSTIVVNDDGSVDFKVTQDNWHNNSSQSSTTTSYIEAYTLIGQKINLAENPWLMTRWSGSGRVNGRIYISFTKDGVEYGKNGIPLTGDNAIPAITETTVAKQGAQNLIENNLIMLTLSNIINNNSAGYKYTNQTETDFNAGSVQDFTVDLYEYLNKQISDGNISLKHTDSNNNTVDNTDKWPNGGDWLDSKNNYITVYMSCQIMASEAGQPLTVGTNTHWEQFALGREVLDRPASMLPRAAEFMNITDTSGTNGVDYGRVSSSVDGTVTFSNTAPADSGKSVVFGWNLRRYFNASELESLHIEATFTGMDADDFEIQNWFGGRTTSYLSGQTEKYNYRGVNTRLQDMIARYSRNHSVTSDSIASVVDFHRYLSDVPDDAANYGEDYKEFFPDDSLIFIGDIKLTLPAGAKITFTRLEFQVENEEIPATKSNTAYPWYSNNLPDSLPPEGTPTYSTALNDATGRSYDWAAAASEAPVVDQKIDMLSMKTFKFSTWDHKVLKTANDEVDEETGVITPLYERYADGSSVYQNLSDDFKSNLTAAQQEEAYGDDSETNAFYTIMRYGETTEVNWERNYYIYLDMDEVPYLYYSYELIKEDENDSTEPKAGFYFHFNNSRREKYAASSTEQKWCYQYYLDHSGIGLNECSSVYALGNNYNYYSYGTEAILSNTKARTGCIDISSLYVEGLSDQVNNGEYLQLEALRIYLGPNTKIKINYFFFGSESLSNLVVGSAFPVTAGDAYPWAVSKETFDAATDPDSDTAEYTFANKIDLISTLQDLENLNDIMGASGAIQDDGYPWDGADVVETLKSDGTYEKVTDANGKHIPRGNVTVNADGSIGVTVTDTSILDRAYRFKAGTSFDYLFRINIDTTDLSSIRYLNYSVDAPAGMRWAFMFSEPQPDNNNTMRRAITTWCDSDAKWGNDENIQTSAPAGKTYFRMSTSGGYAGPDAGANAVSEYDTYWQNKNNSSWRLYAIPGSQTGCIDLTQVTSDFSWSNGMVSIYMVAYLDPTFTGYESYGSTVEVDPTVTFNYAYLTSTPIKTTDVGKGADKAGTIYNWGAVKTTAPSVSNKVDFIPSYSTPDVWKWDTTMYADYYPNGIFDMLRGTLTEGDGAADGNVSVNNSGTLTATAPAEYSFTIKYDQNYTFNATTLKTLHLNVEEATDPYRIALKFLDKNGEETWIYITHKGGDAYKNATDGYKAWYDLPSATVGTDSDLLPAGERELNLPYAQMLSDAGLDTSKVYLAQVTIRFKASSSSSKLTIQSLRTQNQSVDLSETPYLYYSYRLIDKQTGKTVTNLYDKDGNLTGIKDLRVGMSIMDTNASYYFRTMTGFDSAGTSGYSSVPLGSNYGYGNPSFIRLSTSSSNTTGKNHFKTPVYGYASETGCIDLRQYHTDSTTMTLNYIRIYLDNEYYFDTDRYEFIIDYMFLGSEATHKSLSKYTQAENFAYPAAPVPADYQEHVVTENTVLSAGTTAVSPALKVDLNKTPYLFYSIKYSGDTKGTFGLTYNDGGNNTMSFYRDVGRKDGHLISKGTSPTQYIQQSETGCIDVRSWNLAEGLKTTDIIYVTELTLYNTGAEIVYMYFGAEADKTIDLLPEYSTGNLDNGLPTRTWVNQGGTANAEYDKNGNPITASKPSTNAVTPSTTVDFKGGDITDDGFNDLWYSHTLWSQIYLSYGNITNRGARSSGDATDFKYRSSGNNQMSGLMIDLNETPYLHFSLEQPENSRTSMLLQLNDWTSTQSMLGKTADNVRPWLSMYCPTSSAGQLVNIVSSSYLISFYKDYVMEGEQSVMVAGNQGGVIDLRSWFTVTNGCDNVISLDSIRFYTHAANAEEGYIASDVKVNYLYLSSSSSAAYSVTFHKNDGTGEDGTGDSYTQYVLQNANEQYVSDAAVKSYKERKDAQGKDTHIFVGWYTDPECENYFDIQGTPMTGNIDLYARWIDVETLPKEDNVKEVNLLASMDISKKILHSDEETGNGIVSLDNEALTVKSTGTEDFVVEFPVNKSYSVNALRSLFMGFDNDLTCKGFDITLNAKSSTSRSYSLIQDAFYHTYLTDNKLLTAAPHDGESAFYTYLGVRNDLPVSENKNGLIEVKSITLTVPAGVSAEIRYIKSGNEMALMGNTDTRAPQSELKDQTFDLLKNETDDPAFVITSTDIVYNELESKSMTYEGIEYTQVSIHGREDGFAHIGGLYDYSIDMTVAAADNPGRWLQFSVDQSTDSYFTFALYASFSGMVEGDNAGVIDEPVYDIHTSKSVSYFDSSLNDGKGGLVIKDLDVNSTTFIPADSAYINGSKTYWLDLYSWYKDALKPYRSNSEVQEVKILGLRLFTDSRTTDTTINYMFIGGNESDNSSAHHVCWVEYPYRAGANKATIYEKDENGNYIKDVQGNYVRRENVVSDSFQILGYSPRGTTFYVTLDTLDCLKDDAPINDPTKKFVGWVFRDNAVDRLKKQYMAAGMTASDAEEEAKKPKTDAQLMPYLVYWNPDPTNGNMYDPESNKGGSWSLSPVEGFVTDRKSVFYNFVTVTDCNTQILVPLFADADYEPTLTATVEGSGTVSLVSDNTDIVSKGTNIWTAHYNTTVVLRATGDTFAGWYDQNNVLLSLSKDYRVLLVSDTKVTAKFAVASSDEVYREMQEGRSIVWLQSSDKTAGTDFYLESINGDKIYLADGQSIASAHKSNIDDLTGNTQIACYWNIANAQLLKAVAPTGYHWEQLLSDGSSVRVSAKEEYVFIASTNVKLVAVQGTENFETTVLIDEFCFDDDRTNAILRFNGQVVCAENEEVVTCGLTFTDFKNHGEIPSLYCNASDSVTATAWNSTTGQFVVEFSIENSPEYVIRAYAVTRNVITGQYTILYSDCVASVF